MSYVPNWSASRTNIAKVGVNRDTPLPSQLISMNGNANFSACIAITEEPFHSLPYQKSQVQGKSKPASIATSN